MRPSMMRKISVHLLYLFLISIFLFLVFRPRVTSQRQFKINIKKQNPQKVWNFLSDLGHLRLANPNIVSIDILDETVHLTEWRYLAKLTERVDFFGDVEMNVEVIARPDLSNNQYLINMKVSSCKLTLCVDIDSEISIQAYRGDDGQGSVVHEKANVTSPYLLSSFTESRHAANHEFWFSHVKRLLEGNST